jgi:hypothetical protein
MATMISRSVAVWKKRIPMRWLVLRPGILESPEQTKMKPVNRRIARLECRFAPRLQPDFEGHPRDRLRLVVSAMDHALNLETSTCRWMLTASGILTEVVRLDGIHGGLSDEELDKFVQSSPIKRV